MQFKMKVTTDEATDRPENMPFHYVAPEIGCMSLAAPRTTRGGLLPFLERICAIVTCDTLGRSAPTRLTQPGQPDEVE
jgi:hypothetical protein